MGKLGTDGVPDFMNFYTKQRKLRHVNYDERFNMPAASRVLTQAYQEQNDKLEALTDMGSRWQLLA